MKLERRCVRNAADRAVGYGVSDRRNDRYEHEPRSIAFDFFDQGVVAVELWLAAVGFMGLLYTKLDEQIVSEAARGIISRRGRHCSWCRRRWTNYGRRELRAGRMRVR